MGINRDKPSRHLYNDAINHPIWDSISFFLLMSFELLVSSAIIWKVPYTEIDWEAYMQEVSTAWDLGERNYIHIRGSTGPLVYPAGFLYLYGALRWMVTRISNHTDVHPSTIFVAQVVFTGLYLIQMILVLCLYIFASRSIFQREQQKKDPSVETLVKSKRIPSTHGLWSWRIAMLLCCLSKRIHSIFMLRLFNDGLAMLILYYSIYQYAIKQGWKMGCVIFSLAVSVKMNILLFAPGLLCLLLQVSETWIQTLGYLFICASIQLLLGAPFLLTFPLSYLRKAFELDRVFAYEWTVNLKVSSANIYSISFPFCHR